MVVIQSTKLGSKPLVQNTSKGSYYLAWIIDYDRQYLPCFALVFQK